MRYRSVDLCFSDPEGQTTQTCPRRLRGRQARRWGGGDRQWSAESVTKSGRSSAWHHCFVSEELTRSQPAAERGVCAVPTTWAVFFMNRMYWSSYSRVLHFSLSLCVCVYINLLSLSGSVVSTPRGDDVTTETAQRCRCQTHIRRWDTKQTSTSFEFIYSIAVVLNLCNSKAPKNF